MATRSSITTEKAARWAGNPIKLLFLRSTTTAQSKLGSEMKTAFLLLLVLAFIAGLFARNPKVFYRIQPVSSNANRPSATEIFNLRSKCAELGEKIMEGNHIGSALTQSQVSHYDSGTNRCYVELDVNVADLSKWDEYNSRCLFDGQTGELLGWVKNEKGKKAAYVTDSPNVLDYDAAAMKIGALMADDRKQ
jgi:hypothetical protein